MLLNLKALIVVLVLAITIFALAKPVCLRFMTGEDFTRRRNLWIALTVAAFLSPSFWLYVLVATPLLLWAGARDSNPLALYFIVWYVIPPGGIEIPTVLIKKLFELDNFRLLAILLLLPVAVRQFGNRTTGIRNSFRVTDALILSYGLLLLVLLLPYESITNTMRRAFLYGLDVLLVYYVFSRQSVDRRRVVESLAVMCLGVAIMAAIGAFEFARHWLLYTGINEGWGNPNVFAFLLREDSLRAQASSGHAIVLGYLSAMALGFWLFLQLQVPSLAVRLAVIGLFWAGLVFAVSRAPWLVAVAIYLSFYLLAPVKGSKVILRFALISLFGAIVLVSPYGAGIVDRLPFVGTVDAGSVDYRTQLAALSWKLIQDNPFFGSPFVLAQMEELRQGQGIIDLMNTYATIGMFYGGVGLALFLGVFVHPLVGCVRVVLRTRRVDPAASAYGASIAAGMLGTLLMMATGSFGNGLAILYWALAGIASGFVVSAWRERAEGKVPAGRMTRGRMAAEVNH